MLPKRYAQPAFMLYMAFTMSCVMSLVLTVINLGWVAVPMPWLRNWGLAFVIAVPTIAVLAPIGQKLIARITVE